MIRSAVPESSMLYLIFITDGHVLGNDPVAKANARRTDGHTAGRRSEGPGLSYSSLEQCSGTSDPEDPVSIATTSHSYILHPALPHVHTYAYG